jgi:small subunit ribosomal protein S10
MKFRLILKSFNKEKIRLLSKDFQFMLLEYGKCNVTEIIALPIKIKKFCVLRSPHVDKNSREHFELRIYKEFLEFTTAYFPLVFNILLNFEIPAGIFTTIRMIFLCLLFMNILINYGKI